MSAEEKYDEYGRLIIDSESINKLSYKIGVGLLSEIKDKNVNNISTYELNKTSNAAIFIYDTNPAQEKELLSKNIVIKDLNGSIIWKAKMADAKNTINTIDGERYKNIYISEKAINASTINREDMICTICLDGLEDNIKILEIIKDNSLEDFPRNNHNISQGQNKNGKQNEQVKNDKSVANSKVTVPGMQKSNDRVQQSPGMQRTRERMPNSGMQRGNDGIRNSQMGTPGIQKSNDQVRNQRTTNPGMQRGNDGIRDERVQVQRREKINENIKSEEIKMQESQMSNVSGSKENIKNTLILQALKYVNTQVNVFSNSEIQSQMMDSDIIIEKIRNKYVVLVRNLSLKPMYLLDQYNKFFEFDGNINEFIEQIKQIMIKMYRFTEEEFESLRITVINDENYGMANITRGNVIRRMDLLKQIKDKYMVIDFINTNPFIIINEDVRTEVKLAMNNYDFKNFCLQIRNNFGEDLVVYDEKIFDEEQNCLLDILI